LLKDKRTLVQTVKDAQMKIEETIRIAVVLLAFSLALFCACAGDDDDDDDDVGGTCYCYCEGTDCEVSGLNNPDVNTENGCEEWCTQECLNEGCPLKNSWLSGADDEGAGQGVSD